MALKSSRRGKEAEPKPLSSADPKVLDLAHLARYTIGNRELEEELLKLFRAQLRTQATAIGEATDAEAWRFATHTLKGVARSIGAWAVANSAERLELLGPAGHDSERHRLLAQLEVHTATCEREIDRIIGLKSSPPAQRDDPPA